MTCVRLNTKHLRVVQKRFKLDALLGLVTLVWFVSCLLVVGSAKLKAVVEVVSDAVDARSVIV